MSRGGQKSGPGSRAITSDEAQLWERATRTLEPLKGKPRIGSASPVARQNTLADLRGSQPKPAPAKDAKRMGHTVRPETETQPTSPPPLADFDRRQARRIAAGRTGIDASIDLHGLRQSDAHARLRKFLFDAHARGLRTVLVITGKGGEPDRSDHMRRAMGEQQRGVLRRNVPLWLAERDLKGIVLSFTAAGVRHGGSGALYVQLRKSG